MLLALLFTLLAQTATPYPVSLPMTLEPLGDSEQARECARSVDISPDRRR